MKKKRKRTGLGRPALPPEKKKVAATMLLSPDVLAYLRDCDVSMPTVVESAIRRSKAFREWKKENGE